jgi:Methyltransferase domain
MLDLAGVGEGARVLDVAAGAGGQTLTAARRVGPAGRVLASDIAPAILDYAAAEARRAGLANVATRAMEASSSTSIPGPTTPSSRGWGSSTSPTSSARSAGCAGGCVPAAGWPRSCIPPLTATSSSPCRSQSFAGARSSRRLPPGQPGPFSLGGPGVLEEAFTAAGFRDVVTRLVPAPLRLASASDCVRFERESFGALHQMLAGLDEPGREAAWTEIAEALAQFEGSSGFEGPCEMLVAAGTK